MKDSRSAVLLDAAKRRRSNETFEKALSRVVREHHGSYSEYIELIAQVRERARKDGGTLEEAAKAISEAGP